MKSQNPLISIVVIGKNEGERLTKCLESVLKMDPILQKGEILYVDSDSTDDSIERAKKFNVKILQVKSEIPTPSTPRNAGWKAATGEYILFLDGDTTLDPTFVNKALKQFENLKLGIVCGMTMELYPDANLYHRVFAVDWNPQKGITDYCGGNFMIRRHLLEDVGGFDETLLAGEEPEMMRRIREAGFEILKLDIPMVFHDLNMSTFDEYWNRSVRTGYAYAEVSRRYWNTNDPLWKKESIHNWIKGCLILLFFLFTLVYFIYTGSVIPFLIFFLILSGLILRTAFKARGHSQDMETLLLYGVHSHLQHIPLLIGQINYWLSCLSRGQ